MPARTKLAQLIARREGFGIPGSLPTRNNNPGDLRHSPHSEHPSDPNAIGVIDNLDDGWNDLERQLELYADRGMSLRSMVAIYAPPSENDSEEYLDFICNNLGAGEDDSVASVLQIPAG